MADSVTQNGHPLMHHQPSFGFKPIDLDAAVAIVEAIGRLAHLEPVIAMDTEGGIIAMWSDADGFLITERIYPPENHN